jgi:hypothetical protein
MLEVQTSTLVILLPTPAITTDVKTLAEVPLPTSTDAKR